MKSREETGCKKREQEIDGFLRKLSVEWKAYPDQNLGEVLGRLLGEKEIATVGRTIEDALRMAEINREKRVEEEKQRKIKEYEARCKHPVICVAWLESEAGWGQRPDGYSVHFTEEDFKAYEKAYWDQMPPRDKDGNPPHEYSRPSSDPYLAMVTDEVYQRLVTAQQENKFGIRIFNKDDRPIKPSQEKVIELIRGKNTVS